MTSLVTALFLDVYQNVDRLLVGATLVTSYYVLGASQYFDVWLAPSFVALLKSTNIVVFTQLVVFFKFQATTVKNDFVTRTVKSLIYALTT